MRKKAIRMAATVMALIISTSLAACGSKNAGASGSQTAVEDADQATSQAVIETVSQDAEEIHSQNTSEVTDVEASEEYDEAVDFQEIGASISFPLWMDDMKGFFTLGSTEDGNQVSVFMFMYYGLPYDDVVEYYERYENDELTDEEITEAVDSKVRSITLIALKDMTIEDYLKTVDASDEDIANATITEVGSKDSYKWYAVYGEQENFEDAAYQEEYEAFRDGLIDTFLNHTEYYEPVIVVDIAIGETLSFETVDLDGNTVKSEDIFKDHEITMVNCWTTWCHYCVEELPELEEMSKRLPEKDCAIIGLLVDANEGDDIVELGKSLLKDNGVTYQVLAANDDILSLIAPDGFPTSYFVDRNGVVLEKVEGVPRNMDTVPNGYEEVFNQLLAGEEKVATAPTEAPAAANSDGEYHVIVKDAKGNPVQGVTIQFCDDSTCRVGKTDADGVATFASDEHIYTIHVLKVPDGWESDSKIYSTLDTYSDVFIVLKQSN